MVGKLLGMLYGERDPGGPKREGEKKRKKRKRKEKKIRGHVSP
jgi:hypothetical protein